MIIAWTAAGHIYLITFFGIFPVTNTLCSKNPKNVTITICILYNNKYKSEMKYHTDHVEIALIACTISAN